MRVFSKHTFGLVLLVLSVFTWTLGTFLNASIFADGSFAKPLFITYFNNSTFILMLVPILVKRAYKEHKRGSLKSSTQKLFSRQTLKALFGKEQDLTLSSYSEQDPLLKPDGKPRALPTYTAIDGVPSTATEEDSQYLDLIPTARLAISFCLFWFGANYFTSACLRHTTPASATILGSTQSLWALVVGAITHTEIFTWRKFCGVIATVSGVILITGADLTSTATNEATHTPANGTPDRTMGSIALGDFLALCGAALYGLYALMMKRASLKAYPRNLYMPAFFGFVGVFNVILTTPLFPILHYTGIEPFEWPSSGRVITVIISYAASSLITDLLMAWVTVLTSPLVMTVGLSLNIPLALVGEMLWQHNYKGWLYWVGAAVVVASFIFVDRQEVQDEDDVRDGFMSRGLDNSTILGVDPEAGEAHLSRSMIIVRGKGDLEEQYEAEKTRDGKRREKEVEEDLEDIRVEDANITHFSSSGPSSYDGRYRGQGFR